MLGLRILLHALKQIFGNFRAALQISGLICAVQFGCSYFIFGASRLDFSLPLAASDLLSGVIMIVIWGAGFVWMAVAWHRYVLLNEKQNSVIPQLRIKNMGSYFMRSLLIGLVLIIVVLVLGGIGLLCNAIFAAVFPSAVTGWVYGAMLYPLALNLVSSMLFFSLSPILVAGALGKEMSFAEAQSAFSGKLASLFVLAFVVGISSWIGGAIVSDVVAHLADVPGAAIIVEAIYYWVSAMAGISILTTLYGHFTEKRELV